MSDRLKELQRQRALAQEQVAWFDREIARESGGIAKTADPVVGGVPPPREIETPAPNPDELLKQYQSSGTSIHSEVKRGCLMYFFAALALLALGIAAFWFFWKR
jgi:hypothetical protein